MRRAFVGVFIVVVAACWGMAQEVPAGFGAAPFARIGIDARPLAMGGTGVAIGTGNPIPYYNSARLALAPPLAVGGMYSEPYGQDLGISFQSLCALGSLGSQTGSVTRGGIGVTWIQMSIADIPIWDEENPGAVAFFTATSSLYMASVAVSVLPELSLGITGKVYRERILEGRGQGVGADIGALVSLDVEGIPVWFGINSMDFGRTNIRWHQTTGEPDNYVPWVNKVGVSASFFDGRGLVAADFDWAVGRPPREQKVHLGLEANPVEAFFLRAGWSGDLEGSDSRFSVGLGIDFFDSFRLDYAFVPPRTVFGTGHFLSLHLSFPFSAEWLSLSGL